MEVKKKVPDYSAYNHKFECYCYTPPNDGKWIDEGGVVRYSGQDFRTVERYKEYKDCGFDILLMQTAGKFDGTEAWEESNAKKVMDKAWEAGIEKIIMTDIRLQHLSEGIVYFDENGKPYPDGKTRINYSDANDNGVKMEIDLLSERLVCADGPFQTEAELDEYVSYCMAPYKDYHGFYGVQLKDEPNFKLVTFYGETYRSIKRVCPTAFIQYNLNQVYTDSYYYYGYPGWEGSERLYLDKNFPGWRDDSLDLSDETVLSEMRAQKLAENPNATEEELTFSPYQKEVYICAKLKKEILAAKLANEYKVVKEGFKRYGNYVGAYIDHTGADYCLFDTYPLKGGSFIREQFIHNMQTFARVCVERGARPEFVTQTESEVHVPNGALTMRKINEKAARWLNNLILGFGAKRIVYYTYFNKGWSPRTLYPDGTSFITHLGERTELYYFMKKIIAENQKFAPVILNFDYKTSNVYACSVNTFPKWHTRFKDDFDGFECVDKVLLSNECAIVTELYDKSNNRYMYMAQNIVDPDFDGERAHEKLTLVFKEGFTKAAVFVNGERTDVELDEGKYVVELEPGDAVFVIPY